MELVLFIGVNAHHVAVPLHILLEIPFLKVEPRLVDWDCPAAVRQVGIPVDSSVGSEIVIVA